MPVYYNSHTGQTGGPMSSWNPENLLYQSELHLGIGWHEFGTVAEMQAFIKANHFPPATGNAAAKYGFGNALGKEATGTAGAAANTATGGVTDFLSRLSSKNVWLRVLEGVLGMGLIIVAGIAAVKNTEVGSAAKTALKVIPK